MKKTYVTTMPDDIGAFLKASRCFAELDINITRVSYNKAIDSNTLFLDASGTADQLEKADKKLSEIGYLPSQRTESSIVLLEFSLPDVPGSVTDVLALIQQFDFNISYISSQENGSDIQPFKMGLHVDDVEKIQHFLEEAKNLCPVKVIQYSAAKNTYDNSIFYNSFVSELSARAHLSAEMENALLVNTNLAMQTLDEQGQSPYRTFDSIARFAELLAACKGEQFNPRISSHALTEETHLTLIEPPCGSNTAILRHKDQTLFIDCGYACYRQEMEALFRKLLPDYDALHKTVLITHADVDHCGLLPLFDTIIASQRSADCLHAEYHHQNGFREQNTLHRPYINICKILTGYMPPTPEKIQVLHPGRADNDAPLMLTGFFTFGDLHFEVYEGKGGHLPGEIILIDYAHHIVFSGDVYLNLKGFTAEQARYNRYAPILMTSVDTDPALCAQERQMMLQRLGPGPWRIFGAHGSCKEYTVEVQP
ncbi:MAG: MBL fold metallo-hydrolase [Clostridia bacterium]|nr:MBL fold metallo-hydrolase [Clostridia bacterium]